MTQASDERDDGDENPNEMACEVCGDYYPYDSLTRCDTCSWLMCESCESEQGNCYDCARELGLINDDD